MKIISVGEILWDLVNGREYLGGAPLNFAMHAAQLGHEVLMVSAIGNDDRGERALTEISARGLRTDHISRVTSHPTGTVTVNMSAEGHPSYTIHRPVAYDFPALNSGQLKTLNTPPPEWIYFGTLQHTSLQAHQLLQRILDASPNARRCYDINLRLYSHSPALIHALLSAANVLKLNEDEVDEVNALQPGNHKQMSQRKEMGKDKLEGFCRSVALAFNLEAVCVTRGADGCVLLLGNEYVVTTAPKVTVADTIGAGDAFCAALLHGINLQWSATQIARFACAVGALIASRAGGTPLWHASEIAGLP